jgi:hypothetical protein
MPSPHQTGGNMCFAGTSTQPLGPLTGSLGRGERLAATTREVPLSSNLWSPMPVSLTSGGIGTRGSGISPSGLLERREWEGMALGSTGSMSVATSRPSLAPPPPSSPPPRSPPIISPWF